MRTLDLIVRTVGPLSPSKFDYPYHYVVLKSIDKEDKTKYVLNLQKREDSKQNRQIYQNWLNNLKPGAVLRCVMQDKHPNNVDQWKAFTLIKKHDEGYKAAQKRGPKTFESPEEAGKLTLGLQIDKIEEYARGILVETDKIKKDFNL